MNGIFVNQYACKGLQVDSRVPNMEKASINDWSLEIINIQREVYGTCTTVTLIRTVCTRIKKWKLFRIWISTAKHQTLHQVRLQAKNVNHRKKSEKLTFSTRNEQNAI